MNEALENSNPSGPFFSPQGFSMADMATLPWMVRMPVLKHYRDYDIPETLTHVHAWIKAGLALESVRKTSPSIEYMVEGYRSYAMA
jgi:hypothetical protein